MEFNSRGAQGAAPAPGHPAAHQNGSSKRKIGGEKSARYLFLVFVVGVALLLVALVLFTASSNGGDGNQSSKINTKQYQAVFLNNGQVYFGKITTYNKTYAVLNDVYYIEAQSTQQASSNNYTLRKLGTSELHAPEDQMVINSTQITFWENIKDSGRVVSAINEYKKNPNAANQVQSQDNTSNTQPDTTGTNTNQTGTNNTTKKQ